MEENKVVQGQQEEFTEEMKEAQKPGYDRRAAAQVIDFLF